MVSGPPSGLLLQVTLLGHWLFFFRTFSISGVFAYLHLTRKTREGLRRADDIVMERVGPVTRLALLLHGWGAIHLLRGNRANQPIGGVLYISEVTTGKSHVIHYTWPNIGWSLAKLKTAKNAKLARTSTLAPHKKVESTDHIFSAIATAANLPISWVAHKGKPQSKNLLNLLHLVILSIFVLVIDDLDELVLWWSQGPHMIHVLKAHAWPRFPSVFDFLLPSVLQIGAAIWPPSPNCALEIYWIRHHLPCKNGKMWVLQQFNFTLSFSFNFKICLYKLRKANRCVLSFFFVWGVKFGYV